MAITDNPRPNWPFQIEQSLALWLNTHAVRGVELKIISDESMCEAKYFLELTPYNTGRDEPKPLLPVTVLAAREVLWRGVGDYHGGLLRLSSEVSMRVSEITAWDAAHKRERQTYERLKKKFGGI